MYYDISGYHPPLPCLEVKKMRSHGIRGLSVKEMVVCSRTVHTDFLKELGSLNNIN
jgi:hypothetical protein